MIQSETKNMNWLLWGLRVCTRCGMSYQISLCTSLYCKRETESDLGRSDPARTRSENFIRVTVPFFRIPSRSPPFRSCQLPAVSQKHLIVVQIRVCPL